MADLNYTEYLKTIKNSLRDIQTSVLLTNESDEKGSSDADLDALLKGSDNSNNSDSSNDNNKDSSMPDLSDLGLDDKDGGNKDSENNKEDDDKSLDNLDLEKPDDSSDSDKNFETDSDGLIDTITKLTKSGKTVKILVSAEGKQYFDVNGKKVNNIKELSELANKSVKGGLSMQESKVLSALYGQIKSMRSELNDLKSNRTSSLTEDRILKIPESKYVALTEMNDDLTRKIEEQSIIIKNYESYKNLTENDNGSIENMLDTLSETINETNKVINDNSFNTGLFLFNKGRSIALNTLTEDVMPLLHELNDTRSAFLSEIDTAEVSNTVTYTPVSEDISPVIIKTMNKLNNISESISNVNRINKLTSLVESKLYGKENFTKSDILKILDEASSDIVIIPEPELEFNSTHTNGYPYSGFEQRVKSILQTAASKSASYKSQIFMSPEDSNGNFISRAISRKIDLPLYNPEKYNTTTTVKSAILNLAESLTDIDGNINLDMAKKAYLYKKTSKPSSLKDFAFPIAICENKQLYAHPELIKTAANILKDDKCMKVYGIDSRETLYQLRESLNPYLEAIKVDIPWLALDESKKAKAKKCKCKECGAECDECSKDGLCPGCEKEAKKKASKNKSKK